MVVVKIQEEGERPKLKKDRTPRPYVAVQPGLHASSTQQRTATELPPLNLTLGLDYSRQ